MLNVSTQGMAKWENTPRGCKKSLLILRIEFPFKRVEKVTGQWLWIKPAAEVTWLSGECLAGLGWQRRHERKLLLCSFAMADLRLSIKIVCLSRRPKFCSGTQVWCLTTPIPGYPTSSFGFHVYPRTGDIHSCRQTHKHRNRTKKTLFCCRELRINTTRMNSLNVTRKQRKKSHCHRSPQIPTGRCSWSLAGVKAETVRLPHLYIHVAQTTVRSRTLCSVTAWTLTGGTWCCSLTSWRTRCDGGETPGCQRYWIHVWQTETGAPIHVECTAVRTDLDGTWGVTNKRPGCCNVARCSSKVPVWDKQLLEDKN